MNNLFIFMTLCGSAAFLIYMILKRLLGHRISPVYRYLLIKIVLAFYLLPIPLLANKYKSVVRNITGNRTLFSETMGSGMLLPRNPEKEFRQTYTGIHFPQYRMATIVLFVILFIVVCVFLGYCFYKYQKVKKVVLRASKPKGFYEKLLSDDEVKIIKKHKVMFRRTTSDVSPFTFGLLRPVIVLPESMKEKEQVYVVRHELVHVTSRDNLLRIFGLFAVAVHFYNPLIYVLFREISVVCELRCDQKVLECATEKERKEYGHLLIHMATKTSGMYCVVPFSKQTKRELQERIVMIKQPAAKKITSFVCTVVLMLACGTMPVLAYTPPVLQKSVPHNDEDTFRYTDTYFLSDDGDIFTVYENEGATSSCDHMYVSGQEKKHKPRGLEGCIVDTIVGEKCIKCGSNRNVTGSSNAAYETCTHD